MRLITIQSKLDRVDRAREVIRGVYAITRDEPDTAKLIVEVGKALSGGVRLLQYRNKLASKRAAWEQAVAMRSLTAAAGANLIVNDDVDLALAVSADGVHIGRNDSSFSATSGDLSSLRQRVSRAKGRNAQFLIGISCYDEIARAKMASAAGADYIAFGSFFPSLTKPHAMRADLSLIRTARRETSLPVVAIGGITIENAPQLVAAGVDAIALISALFAADDITSRAHFFSSLFPENV